MDNHRRGPTTLRSTQPALTRRRIILFPLPFEGHINPMLQLANILHTQGFDITIIPTEDNSPNPSKYPHFTFKSISKGLLDKEERIPSNTDPVLFAEYLNRSCVDPFRDCLVELSAESDKESVACLITDAGFYFTQAVANELNLPRLVPRTSSIACALVYSDLKHFTEKGYFNLTKGQFSIR